MTLSAWNKLSVVFLLLTCPVILARDTTVQLVTLADPAQLPSGGNGDSQIAALSPDGRFVLFSSTANNLTSLQSTNPLPAHFPAVFNVFLRDRLNGTMVLVSENLARNGGGNDDSLAVAISTNGHYVLFESSASDLVTGDTNNAPDVFLRDIVNGTTLLVSASTNGGVGHGRPASATMTPDARCVAFVSEAEDLTPADTNAIADVFLRDMQSMTTILVSVGGISVRTKYPFASSEAPQITPDGKYVAFYSTTSNLVPDSVNSGDVYVRDVAAGKTTWISSGALPAVQSILGATNAVAYNHVLSADGKFVAYEASAGLGSGYGPGLILRYHLETGLTDLVYTNANVPRTTFYQDEQSLDMTPDGRFIAAIANANATLGSNTCIIVWDAQTGNSVLASGDPAGNVPTNSVCKWPVLDATGRFVAFNANGKTLATNQLNGEFHLFLRDLEVATTSLLNVDTNGVGWQVTPLTIPHISADAHLVAFEYPDGAIVANDRNREYDVILRDATTGANELVSAHDPALPSRSPNSTSTLAFGAASFDGRYLAFSSDADNLTPDDTNALPDIFLRDLALGSIMRVSAATNGTLVDGPSAEPVISSDGRYVAFSSLADNLVPGDTNNAQDVFLRDVQTGTTYLVSVAANGGSGDAPSHSPLLSSDGRLIAFISRASNLAPGSLRPTPDNLFVRDRLKGLTYPLNFTGVTEVSMTPDGHFVAFIETQTTTFGSIVSMTLSVWDSLSSKRIYTNTSASFRAPSISPDGNRLLFVSGMGPVSQLFAADLQANTNGLIDSHLPASHYGLRFSSDSRFAVYAEANTGVSQVHVYDFLTGSNQLIGSSSTFPELATAGTDSPDISADGRFVTLRNAAADFLPAEGTWATRDIFLFDRLTGLTSFLRANPAGTIGGNGFSLNPFFTANGRKVFFQSWASDLVGLDFNHTSDLFAVDIDSSVPVTGFRVTIDLDGSPANLPQISWPASRGKTYRVQFKNQLSDPDWQDLAGGAILVGNQAYFQDPAPGLLQRFYRILAF